MQLLFILFIFFLTGCTNPSMQAPVADMASVLLAKHRIHIVKPGETLYAVAWLYRFDPHYLATLNRLQAPYALTPGQVLYLKGRAPHIKKYSKKIAMIKTKSLSFEKELPLAEQNKKIMHWSWPAQGKLIQTFSAAHKGITLAGVRGAPIYAAAPGRVVYSDHGLREYGNLLIIKHAGNYLTAYAHSDVLLVKVGEWVHERQEIAQMGSTGARRVALYFEIRQGVTSVDPLRYLILAELLKK